MLRRSSKHFVQEDQPEQVADLVATFVGELPKTKRAYRPPPPPPIYMGAYRTLCHFDSRGMCVCVCVCVC